jgi:glutamate racemase
MIGVFDSGYGGLTILKEFVKLLPSYDYCYLGDNARTPYGIRSFDTVYRYTGECVKYLFENNCHLVILACNTASAKALRNIQQFDIQEHQRVLGVIRPCAEVIGKYTKTGVVGILGTSGTVQSCSYPIEISKIYPKIQIFQEACNMWVPLVENAEYQSDGADYFVKKDIENLLKQNSNIDVIVLACTHYPILIEKIKKYTPKGIKILSQGDIVARSLADYLLRHPQMEKKITKNGKKVFKTTDSTEMFDTNASLFFGEKLKSEKVSLPLNI